MSDTPREPDLGPALRELHAMVTARLARHDCRYTEGRRRLIEALAGAGRPVTLPEIASSAPDLPLSSAYRNLEVLERAGVVNRITSGAERAHFELGEPLLSHHHHLVCVACGTIEDVELDEEFEKMVDRSLAEVARRAEFTPLRHMLDLHGHCSDCTLDADSPVLAAPPLHAVAFAGPRSEVSSIPDHPEIPMAHVHTEECYDHPEHTHADHADHCGMEEHSHADHCREDHDHSDHCDTVEHSHADHADHCDTEVHVHAEECCNAA